MLACILKAKQNAVPHVSFYDPLYDRDMAEGLDQKANISEFFRVLALCHDVVAERVDGVVKLSASNPDDEALVCAAEYFGCKFVDRQDKYVVINVRSAQAIKGDSNNTRFVYNEERVELLDTLAFTSKRKRMSVLIRDPKDLSIRLLTKGADTAILERLRPGQAACLDPTMKHLGQYSNEGLRCLLLGHTAISQEKYVSWSKEYRAALTDLVQIDRRKKGESNRIEELEDSIEQVCVCVCVCRAGVCTNKKDKEKGEE